MWGLQNYRLLGHNAELQQTDPGTKLWATYIIYTNKTHCRFDCLFGFATLFRLKSDRHETRHVVRTSTRRLGKFSYYILYYFFNLYKTLLIDPDRKHIYIQRLHNIMYMVFIAKIGVLRINRKNWKTIK